METVNIEPNWEVLFDNAIWQVKAVVAKDDMQAFIVKMLEFGKRLHIASRRDKEIYSYNDVDGT